MLLCKIDTHKMVFMLFLNAATILIKCSLISGGNFKTSMRHLKSPRLSTIFFNNNKTVRQEKDL